MTIYNSTQLLKASNTPETNENIAIAHIILRIYNSAKNFYQDDMIQLMKEYNNTGALNFNKYNIQFSGGLYMIIENTIQFDNTLSVKQFAQTEEARRILENIPVGKQEFIYNVGNIISFNGVPEATITERYKQNGYCYYTCTWTTGKRKKQEHFSRERQQDITLIKGGIAE